MAWTSIGNLRGPPGPIPDPVSLQLYLSGDYTLTTGAGQTIPWGTANAGDGAWNDNDGMWDAATPRRIYVRTSGVFELIGQVKFSQGSTGTRGLYFCLNGESTQTDTFAAAEPVAGTTNSGTVFQVSARKRFIAGDTIFVRAFQNQGGPLQLQASAYGGTWFSAIRIRT